MRGVCVFFMLCISLCIVAVMVNELLRVFTTLVCETGGELVCEGGGATVVGCVGARSAGCVSCCVCGSVSLPERQDGGCGGGGNG